MSVAAGNGWVTLAPADRASFYGARVAPIFEKYCVACHGAKKAKDGLRMDYHRLLEIGGEEGSALAAGGDPQRNIIQYRLGLSQNNILAMPPLGYRRPTAKEIAVVELWLAAGAPVGAPESDFPSAPAAIVEVQIPAVDQSLVAALRLPQSDQYTILKKRYPSAVSYASDSGNSIVITGASLGEQLNDIVLAELAQLAAVIEWADLNYTAITDQAISLLVAMPALEHIGIAGTNITQQGLAVLVTHSSAKAIVTEAGLASTAIKYMAKSRGVVLYER